MNWFWFFIFLALFLIISSRQLRYGIGNLPYSFLFTLAFILFPLLSTIGMGSLFIPSDLTYVCVIISIFSYFISYNHKPCIAEYIGSTQIYKTNERLLLLSNIIVTIVLLYVTPRVMAFQSANLFRLTRTEDGLLEIFGSAAIATLYGCVVKTILPASFLVLFDDLIRGVKIKKTLLYFVMGNILYEAILFGGRSLLVELVMYTGIYVVFFHKDFSLSGRQKKKLLVTLSLVAGLSIFVLLFVTNLRTEGESSDNFLYDHFLMYYVGPFVLFDYHVVNNHILDFFSGEFPYMGTCLFGPVYNFVFMAISAVFGIDYKGSDFLISQVTQTTKAVISDSGLQINAAVTAMYPFIKDFGIIGLIIGFSVFGYLTRYLKVKYLKTHSRRIRLVTIVFLFVLFKLEMRYDLSPVMFLQVLLIYFFTKKDTIVYE